MVDPPDHVLREAEGLTRFAEWMKAQGWDREAVKRLPDRDEGYWWSSTKQTAMVIYGLTDYLKITNELKPNLTASRISRDRVRKIRFFQPDAYVSIDYAEQEVEGCALGGA